MNDRGLPSQQGRFRGRTGLDVWTIVHRLFNLFSQAVNATLQPFKLSNDELVVLICLAHAGGTLPVGQIERATLFEPDRLRRIVDKLEARGLVTRLHQHKDRRKVFVRVEEDGQRLLDSIAPPMFELVREVMEPTGSEGTEFIRAKLRKMIAYAGTHHRGTPGDSRYDTRKSTGTVQTLTGVAVSGSRGRPCTWGLAGWLRTTECFNQVNRIWRAESHGLGLTVPQLHVLAILAEAGDSLAEDAIARITGLDQDRARTVLRVLEGAGFVRRRGKTRAGSAALAEITEQGRHKVLDSLPMANSFAEELWQGLSDDELERLLSLILKVCTGVERAVERRARDAVLQASRPSLG
jgi:DNA-binding MarR family transcriptional regulator